MPGGYGRPPRYGASGMGGGMGGGVVDGAAAGSRQLSILINVWLGKEGKDVYVEGFYSCVCRKITEGTGKSVGAVRKLVKRFLENILLQTKQQLYIH